MKTRTMIGPNTGATCSTHAHNAKTREVNGTIQARAGLALAMTLMALSNSAMAMSVDLGTAEGFAVLAGTGISFAAPVNSTTITGDIGSYSTAPTAITGTENLVLHGVNHGGDAVTQSAKGALLTAYNDAASRSVDMIYAGGFDIGGRTLNAGVYNSASSLALSGTLTLDAQGDPNAVFIFQMGSTLTTATGSQVLLINGAQAANVIWQIGSSATLATDSYFVGDLLAMTSITLNTGASVDGRMLALNGAVTFDNNSLTVPEAGTLHLLGIGIAMLAAFRRPTLPLV